MQSPVKWGNVQKSTILLLAGLVAGPTLFAQGVAAAGQDVMVFNDGERLAGRALRSNGASAVFKSDAIGEITVDWSKVKELQSSQTFAVIPKNVVLKRGADTSNIPEGTIAGGPSENHRDTRRLARPNARTQTVAVGRHGSSHRYDDLQQRTAA